MPLKIVKYPMTTNFPETAIWGYNSQCGTCKINVQLVISICNFLKSRNLKEDGSQPKFFIILKQLLPYYTFYHFSCSWHSLMNQPSNNLLQIMQHGIVWNLNRVIFAQWKHLETKVNAFWYCMKVIKRYPFHYLIESVPVPRNQSPFEILPLPDTCCYKTLVICFLVLLWCQSKMKPTTFFLYGCTIQFLAGRYLKLTRLLIIISPHFVKFIKTINQLQHP